VAVIMLAERRWITIAAAVASGLALAGLSLALDGLGPWDGYLGVTMPHLRKIMVEFSGFQTSMMLSVFASLRVIGLSY
ncbi:glycosyltransferase 87 family protein, partial [Acinetobacter baumannii]